MSRQPESVDGLQIDMSAYPVDCPPPSGDPQVGDIYKPRAGQPGFWWVVGHVAGEYHDTLIYLTFNLQGQIVGQGKAARYYMRDRQKVGYCPVPPLQPEWFVS